MPPIQAKVYITDGHHVYCGDLDASKKPDSLRKETPQQFMTNVTETLSQTDFTVMQSHSWASTKGWERWPKSEDLTRAI